MKKKIGTKVFSLLVVLTLVFVVAMLMNLQELRSIDVINNEITNIYMKLEKELGNVSTAFQQVQLYGNLSYIKEGTDEESTVKEKLRVAVENLENYMNEMEELLAILSKMIMSMGWASLYTFLNIIFRRYFGISIASSFFFGTKILIIGVGVIVGNFPGKTDLWANSSQQRNHQTVWPGLHRCGCVCKDWRFD